MIRNSIKRILNQQLKNKNVDLTIIEASDGVECIIAVYLAYSQNIKIDFIISDETMPYINGSYCTNILKNMISSSNNHEIPIFICSAVSASSNKNNYSSLVKKIYSKPIDNLSIIDLLSICKLNETKKFNKEDHFFK